MNSKWTSLVAVVLTVAVSLTSHSFAQEVSLEDVAAGRAAIVDLTWPLNDRNGYWSGDGYKPSAARLPD